jgi:hypothetical protein
MKEKNYNFEMLKNYKQVRKYIIVREMKERIFEKLIKGLIGK